MKAVLVTGHRGLVGSAVSVNLAKCGYRVVGIDCDIRTKLFSELSPLPVDICSPIESHYCDIRDSEKVRAIVYNILKTHEITAVVHTAAQPSHDWAKRDPYEDFSLNAIATLKMLMICHDMIPECVFIHFSTNKVYGDNPNFMSFVELDERFELPSSHQYYNGIDETMSIDQCKHSLFGASKLSADVYVQEYGAYYGMKTIILRGGCLTGANHRGTELHGFMNYLIKCAVESKPYNVFGYKGKQVRDNLSSVDIGLLVQSILENNSKIKYPIVANLGGGRPNSISILELIAKLSNQYDLRLLYTVKDDPRVGDHIWYISSNKTLQSVFNWSPTVTIDSLIKQTVNHYLTSCEL